MADILETLQAGLNHHRAGRLAEAEEMYREVLKIHPRHAGAVHLLGLLAFQVGQPELAAQYVEQAVRFDGFHAPYRADLGEIYRALGRIPEAIATYRKALELNSEMPDAHTYLGTLLETEGQTEAAIAHYRQALRLNPRFAEAHAALGIALQRQGQLPEAQSALEQAAQLAPQNPQHHLKLGRCLHAQGKLPQAIECYQQAARLQPDLAEVNALCASARQAMSTPR